MPNETPNNYYTESDPNCLFISMTDTSRKHLCLITSIVMARHKVNALPILKKLDEIHEASFVTIAAHETKDFLYELRLQIMDCIVNMFPNVIFGKSIFIWGLKPDSNIIQVKNDILGKLYNYAIFRNMIYEENHPRGRPKYSIVKGNLKFPLLKWSFKKAINSLNFSLKTISLDYIAKYTLFNVIKSSENVFRKICYFQENPMFLQFKIKCLLIDCFDKINYFNIILFLNDEKLHEFREKYFNLIKRFNLSSEDTNYLQMLFPSDNEIEGN